MAGVDMDDSWRSAYRSAPWASTLWRVVTSVWQPPVAITHRGDRVTLREMLRDKML